MSQQSISVLTLTVTASGTVTASRFVTYAGAQAGAAAATFGVARFAATNGEILAVDVFGTAVVEAGDVITLGAALETDAQGRAIPKASGLLVGRALQAAAAVGDFIEVLLLHA